jgi:hypothetical protein
MGNGLTGRRRGRALAGIAGIAGVVALGAAACTPPPDTTPPTVEAPATAAFVVGSQVLREIDFGDLEFTSDIGARITWSATDDGGVCGADVERVLAGGPPVLVAEDLTTGEYVDAETDYDDQFGGGSQKVTGWRVTVSDCAGNTTVAEVDGGPVAVQEDGTTAGYADLDIDYAGTWGTSSCGCWSGGAVARTTESGATASFTVPGARRLAVVAETAPNRGELSVRVDGVERAVVDTGAAAQRSRVVVWEGAVEPGDEVELVNLATPGRPRIDLDALILR